MKKNETKLFFEKIIGIFAWLSFFLAIFIAIITFFASLSGEKNGKEIFSRKMLIVKGDSMTKSEISENEEIFFGVGDLIVVKTVDNPEKLKAGDVISFVSQSPESLGETVTHKIREIQYSPDGKIAGFITYGINTGKSDTTPAKPEQIIGKYSFKIEGLGNLFLFLKTPQGYYLSILIPAVLLIIFFSVSVGKALGKEDLSKEYNEEINLLKQRVSILEEKESSHTTEIIESNTPLFEEASQLKIPRGEKIAFATKLLSLDTEVQNYFCAVHNELVSYKKLHARLSFKCISYRLGRKLLAKLTVKGKTLNLHLNLKVQDFNENAFHQKDLSSFKIYSEVPFTVKIKSSRGLSNALKLVAALAEKFELSKNDKFAPVDAIKLLKNEDIYKEEILIESVEKDISDKSEVTETAVTEELITAVAAEETETESGFKGISILRKKKISFAAKLVTLDEAIQSYFNKINDELLSFKNVKSRLSFRCISYRFEKKVLAKMTVIGKTLKLHLNLNVQDFNENAFRQKDMSLVKTYSEVPFTVKVKSPRGLSNALKLIAALSEKFELQLKINKI